MIMRSTTPNRGFTLVELLVSMSIGSIVMLAVFSTYIFLGRNLTRLSYRSTLETQSRKILTTFATDIRNAKSITNPSTSTLTLKMTDGATVIYNYSANKLTRNPNGSGAIELNYDIINLQVPVTMPNFSFRYYTTANNTPTYQATTTIVPMSIKQIAINYTLQAGTAAIQGQQGTLTSYTAASGRMLLLNRQLPDGS